MKKMFQVLLASALCSCSLSMVSFAGTWQQEGASWKYLKDDSTYAAGGWTADQGKWYYFDANGYMKTGWVSDNNIWYYLNPTGEMRVEPLIENQVTYYFDAVSGACTNPDAAQAGAAPVLTDQQYLDYINQFDKAITDASKAIEELSNSDSKDTQQTIQLFNELKAPFIQFMEVQAPAKFAQAHERYKNGCAAMIESLDISIQLMSSDNLTSDQVVEYYSKMNALFQVTIDEFTAGDELFTAAG